MAKERSRVVDFGVYLLIRGFVCFVQMLPTETADSLAAGLAWLIYRIDRRHRLVALDNLRHAFGDQFSEAERTRQVQAVYRHFCRLLIEIILLPRKLHANNWKRHLQLTNGREIVDSLLSDRPLLILTGHFGNWEMAGYALGLLGFRTYAVARPLDNPHLDEFLRQFRERTGQRILAKHGDFDRMQKILADGGVIATLGDQDAGQRGLFVDFFGRPASTHKAIALLSVQYDVPMVVILAHNLGRVMEYDIRLNDTILPEMYEGQADAIRVITQRFTSALEAGIRRNPEQYFWLHRRWKHEPPKSRRRAA